LARHEKDGEQLRLLSQTVPVCQIEDQQFLGLKGKDLERNMSSLLGQETLRIVNAADG